jgi:hypothetical protein
MTHDRSGHQPAGAAGRPTAPPTGAPHKGSAGRPGRTSAEESLYQQLVQAQSKAGALRALLEQTREAAGLPVDISIAHLPDAIRDRIEALETPDLYWPDDETPHDDPRDVLIEYEVPVGEPYECPCGRTLGDRRIIEVPLTVDPDGEPDETAVHVCRSEAEALALAASCRREARARAGLEEAAS